ncbi:MAG TPA: NUDIX domain-containing protein [Candidatus Babeliales bacterium]|nr:NUDIX domain-containing protein [Candidatus Babeliales bacterium]
MLNKIKLILLSCLFFYVSYSQEMHVNGGILPFYYDSSGKAFFLIGQEPNGVWADFGGRYEQGENCLETASREFSEETRYVFGKFASGLKNLEKKADASCLKSSIDYIKGRIMGKVIHPKKYYVMYLAHVDYIPAQTFTKAYKVPHYEKQDYEWVPVSEFMETIKKTNDRLHAFYEKKQIRRQIFDVLKAHHDDVIQIIYPNRLTKKTADQKVCKPQAKLSNPTKNSAQ